MPQRSASWTAIVVSALLVCVGGAACQCGPASITVGGNSGGRDGGDAGAQGGTGGSAGTGGAAGSGGGAGGAAGGGSGGTGGSGDAGQACTGSAGCLGRTPHCDLAVRQCVECVRAPDCPSARPACNPATNTCEPACKSSASCALPRPVCDTLVGTCVEGRCEVEGACVAWRRGPWSACAGGSCQSGGGTRTRVVACIDGTGAPNATCSQPAPPASEPCFDVTACGVDAGVAPVDAGPPPFDAGPPPLDAGAPPPDAGPAELCAATDAGALSPTACHVTLLMQTLTANNPTCYVDVAARPGQTAELYWDCGAGTGRAELRFPTLTAAGAWASPSLSVCYGTHFPWSDGCQWQSAQRVEGSPTQGSILQFTYQERPDLGQTGCVVPCTASGTFVVQ